MMQFFCGLSFLRIVMHPVRRRRGLPQNLFNTRIGNFYRKPHIVHFRAWRFFENDGRDIAGGLAMTRC